MDLSGILQNDVSYTEKLTTDWVLLGLFCQWLDADIEWKEQASLAQCDYNEAWLVHVKDSGVVEISCVVVVIWFLSVYVQNNKLIEFFPKKTFFPIKSNVF